MLRCRKAAVFLVLISGSGFLLGGCGKSSQDNARTGATPEAVRKEGERNAAGQQQLHQQQGTSR